MSVVKFVSQIRQQHNVIIIQCQLQQSCPVYMEAVQ